MTKFNLFTAAVCALLVSCTSTVPVIGFIATEPVSITPSGLEFGPFLLNVSEVTDTMRLSAPGHATFAVHDVRHTAGYALSEAFRHTAPMVVSASGSETYEHELRVLLLSSNYNPMGYYANTEYKESPFSFGPRTTSSTTEYRPYSIDTEYKALFFSSDSLVAVFEGAVNTPGVWDMQTNLKKAMERMAEHLNTDVMEFLLKRKNG